MNDTISILKALANKNRLMDFSRGDLCRKQRGESCCPIKQNEVKYDG